MPTTPSSPSDRDRQPPVEVRGNQGVGLPEQHTQDEPVQAEDDDRTATDAGRCREVKAEEEDGTGRDEPAGPPRDPRLAHLRPA